MLSKERKGEIALKFLMHEKRRKGINLCPETFKRDICNTAKSIGISNEEAMEFSRELVEEFVKECFEEK